MGGFKRLAVPVLITVAAYFFVGFVGRVPGQLARAETEPVIVGVPRDFYPEYAIGPDDHPGGFGVDVMNAVAKRVGLSVTYRIFPTWSETLAALEHGDIDLIPVVVITPARERSLLFTRPVLTSPMSIFVRQDEEDIRSVADLAGRRMGVIKGGPAPEWLGKGERARFSCRPAPSGRDVCPAVLILALWLSWILDANTMNSWRRKSGRAPSSTVSATSVWRPASWETRPPCASTDVPKRKWRARPAAAFN